MRILPVIAFAVAVVAAACSTNQQEESERPAEMSPVPLDECGYVSAVADGIDRLGEAFTTQSDLIDDEFSEEWLTAWNETLERIRVVHEDSLALAPPPSMSSIHSDWVSIAFDANGVADALTFDENLTLDAERLDHAMFTIVPDITDRQLVLIVDIVDAAPHCTALQ